MTNISIFGTSSDVGKSTITFVIAKILQDLDYSVAPFKAQNVSNNAHVCDDGSEIGIAQYFQAQVLKIKTSYHLNPILLKSGKNSMASLILEGKAVHNINVRSYYKNLDKLKPIVDKAYEYLNNKYDCVVCEGAGSPVELNLMNKDLSNIYIASKYNTKIILVADIQKGGVFASIYGVYNLLPKKLQKNIIGVIINKFCGDISLFDEGVRIIEEDFKIPVLGILPYTPFNFGFEDSASLMNYSQDISKSIIKVGVIAYPTMSNYNDFEPLVVDQEINLEFIHSNMSLDKYDLIILPGSKLVIKDLQWLKKIGLYKRIESFTKDILGICGGYEMLFCSLEDKYAIENDISGVEKGFAFINDEIIFQKEKILRKDTYDIFSCKVKAFEIHYARSLKYPLFYESSKIKGTFLHEIFDNDNLRNKIFKQINKDYQGFDFQKLKTNIIDDFISNFKHRLDIKRILDNIKV